MTDQEKTKLLRKEVAPFAKSDKQKSIMQLVNTLLPLLALWIGGYAIAGSYPLVALVCAIGAAGFVVRTFIIFHDCTHGSFFQNK